MVSQPNSKSLSPRAALPALMLCLFLLGLHAPVAWGADGPTVSSFAQWTARARSSADRLDEQWSVYVEDLQTGEAVFAFNPNRRLNPASNRKLVTTGLALEKLGPDFQFETDFGLDAPLSDDKADYQGNLVVRSNGDPTLGGPFMKRPVNPVDLLDDWADRLAATGIKTVHGDLILDATDFGRDQDAFPSDVWEPHHKNYGYAAVPSALTFNENVLRITVKPNSRNGAAGSISVFPSSSGLDIENQTRTSSSSNAGVDAQFEDDQTTIQVKGRVEDDGRPEVAVLPMARPLEYFGANMLKAIARRGIKVTGGLQIQTERPDGTDRTTMTRVIAKHESPTLNRLLIEMVQQSDNFLAEQVWRATAAKASDGGADRLVSRRVEQAWLNENGLGWIEPGWDGSGLSRRDLISAQELALITRHIYKSAYRDFLMAALPISGKQGTLRNRDFAHGGGRVQAKTGTLSGVSSLTGFILDDNDKPRLIFSIIGNAPGNTDGRLALRINDLVKLLIEALDRDRLPRAENVASPGAVPALPAEKGG